MKTRLSSKFNRCVKSVKKTVRARKGSNKESAAIAICTKSVLQKRGRTLKSYSRKRLITQRKFRGGLLGDKGARVSGIPGLPQPPGGVGSELTPGQMDKWKSEGKLTAWNSAYAAEKDKYAKELEADGIGTWEGQYRDELNAHMSTWERQNPKPSGGKSRRK